MPRSDILTRLEGQLGVMVQVTFGVPFSFAEILADCRVSTSFMVSIEMCPYVDLQSKISFCIGFMSSITTEVHAYALPSSRQCPQNGGKSHTKLDVCWSLASLRVWIFDAFRMVQHVLAGAFKDFFVDVLMNLPQEMIQFDYV